jgi:acetoin utilization deacetylase AcuC-like enzyme
VSGEASSGREGAGWPAVRRGWRRLRRSLARPRAQFFYSPQYTLDVPGVLQDPARGERILTWLALEGLLRRRDVVKPGPAPIAALRRVHSDAYLDAILEPGGLLPVLGFDPGDPLHERILAVQRHMAGGTTTALRTALADGGVAFHLGGGFHHAHRDRGAGFCAYNDVAIAIAALRADGFGGRILVVDLDLHDGDGTRDLFAQDPTVFTFSIHNQPWGPEEAVASFSLALGTGIDDATYLVALREHLPRTFAAFAPDAVVYVAGADPASDDRLGDWRISRQGMLARDRLVLGLARGRARAQPPLPLAIVLAGGYGPDAWWHAARLAAVVLLGGRRALEPAETSEVLLHRYRQMARLLDPADLSGEGAVRDPEDWNLHADDLYADLGGAPRASRFLGFYTREGLELTLERSQLLARLRAIGFSAVHLDLDLSGPLGETVRLFGDAAHRELLVEVRARRDRSTVPGLELLAVEWMLLQNPRAAFTPERPPLPGQKHPGLGLSQDIVALMVLACERLKLDGIVLVPSRFHIVGTVRGPLRFLDAVDQARLEAVRAAVSELPLAVAARRIESGDLVDAESGEPFEWKPAPMVLPVSDRLKARVLSDAYASELAAARARFHFRLR